MKTLKITPPEGYEIDTEKSTFEEIVFKPVKKNLPKSWEDLKTIEGYYVNGDKINHWVSEMANSASKDVFATESQAKASIALSQLSQLRDVYRNGWKPDWSDESYKACIIKFNGKAIKESYSHINYFLSFQSPEIRDEFLENFRDLIEEASPLLFG